MFPPYRKTHLKLSNQALMPVLELGHGQTSVVIIRGADDGIRSAREFARGWAWLYRHRARGQTIHLISRREDIPAGYSIEDHTRDYIEALDRLQLGPVILECNSAGGFTGPQIAAQRPELVRALVLACTAHRMDAAATETVGQWLKMIDGIRWSDFAWDAAEKYPAGPRGRGGRRRCSNPSSGSSYGRKILTGSGTCSRESSARTTAPFLKTSPARLLFSGVRRIRFSTSGCNTKWPQQSPAPDSSVLKVICTPRILSPRIMSELWTSLLPISAPEYHEGAGRRIKAEKSGFWELFPEAGFASVTWWAMLGLNQRPLACEASALPLS